MGNLKLESYHLECKHGLLHADAFGYEFNGQDDFIALPNTWGGPGWTEATIEAWIRPTANTSDFQAILSSANTTFVHFQLHNEGVGNISVYTDQGVIALPVIPVQPLNEWRHVAVVIKSGATKLLIDGDQYGATNTKTFNHINAANELFVGRGHGNGRHFKGNIAGLGIWQDAHEHGHVHGRIYQFMHQNDKPTIEAPPAAATAGFRSAHGKYMSAQANGTINCNAASLQAAERFTLEHKDGKVGLKGANGKYVSAQPDGRLVCDRDWLHGWELFTMEEQKGKVGFKGAHGKYISAQPDGSITCDRDWLRGWELFTHES